MVKFTRALLAVVLPATALASQALAQAPVAYGVIPAFFDTTCAACQNLYRRANGAWLDTVHIAADQGSAGLFVELFEHNQNILHTIADSLAGSPTPDKVGLFYGTCMDSARAESDGVAPMRAEIARIDGVRTIAELRAEVAHLQRIGTGVVFAFGSAQDFKHSSDVIATVAQGGLGLPERDYYFRKDSVSRSLRQRYLAHVARLLVLTGSDSTHAASDAARVMRLETALAGASLTVVQQRDPNAIYHKMTLAQLSAVSPRFGWAAFLREAGSPPVTSVVVQEPKFIAAADRLLVTTPMADWRAYLRWQYAAASAPWLSAPFVDEAFRYNQLFSGQTTSLPRWKRCLGATDGSLGEALGQQFVARTFTPEAKAKTVALVRNLEGVLKDDLGTLAWMSDSTRQRAIVKLEAFVNKVAYPDNWRDYSALSLARGPFLVNVERATEFETNRQLAKIGRPLDRTEWRVSPPTVDAFYNLFLNEITLPAGILQPPLFDANGDDASNYGGIGAAIGHEMTHGFDDQGRQFDGQGTLRDWWKPADATEYKRRARLIVTQFNGYVSVDTLHVNGELTQGENIADLGGLKIAYAALERSLGDKPRTLIDGLTPEQRFFFAWAQIWRQKLRPEAERTQIQTDPHSPGRWRVNGPLSDMPEFARAFHCQAGDPMVRSDSLRVQIW